LSARGKALWKSVVARFALEVEHLAVLRTTLEAADRCDQARAQLARDGIVTTGARGGLVAHPAVAIERDARIAVLRGFRQLGLDEFADPEAQGRDGRGRFTP
jgi:P27 family predicted phage terminase small subunit